MQVDFYHLSSGSFEPVVVRLAERILGDGGRLLIVSADADAADRIDKALWNGPPDSFLAHGREGEGEAIQPILLSSSCNPANGARFIMLADGLWRDEALEFQRAFFLFDDERIDAARNQWRSLGQRSEIERKFWKQDGGRWVQAG